MIKRRILFKEKKKLKLQLHLQKKAFENTQKSHDFQAKENDDENFMRFQEDSQGNGETKNEIKNLEILTSTGTGIGIGSVIVSAVNGTYEQERRESLLRKHKLVKDPTSSSFSTSTSSGAGRIRAL